jgi:hypothetical protein
MVVSTEQSLKAVGSFFGLGGVGLQLLRVLKSTLAQA